VGGKSTIISHWVWYDGRMDIFEAIAVASSVPFARRITGGQVRAALRAGRVADELLPHIERAVGELPVSMLARAVFAFPLDEREAVIAHLTALADQAGAGDRIRAWLTG
jgi:hypothetical protein